MNSRLWVDEALINELDKIKRAVREAYGVNISRETASSLYPVMVRSRNKRDFLEKVSELLGV